MTSVYKACYYWPKVTDSKSLKIFTCIRVWVIVIDWKVQNRNKIDPNPNSPRSYLPKSTAVLFQFYPRAEWIERNFASMKESLLLFGSCARKKKKTRCWPFGHIVYSTSNRGVPPSLWLTPVFISPFDFFFFSSSFPIFCCFCCCLIVFRSRRAPSGVWYRSRTRQPTVSTKFVL